MKLKKLMIKIFLITCLLTVPLFLQEVLSQVPPPQPQDGIPIDGLSILAILGVSYGVKKLLKKKKEH
jgi:hypothetical protein